MIEASVFYEEKASGLGSAFLDSVEEAIVKIRENPKAYQLVGKEIRRKILVRFPYSILYVNEPDRIRIVAIAHQRRRPEYWSNRIHS
jgi:plasmid stabilization system protein ParE